MSDVAAISDDALIAEVARRELHKRHGMFAYMSERQLDYHAMFAGVCRFYADIEERDGFMAPHVYEMRSVIQHLVDERPDHVRIHSLNTTLYGSEDRLSELARAS